MANAFFSLTDLLFMVLLAWCSVSDLKKREIPNAAILLMQGLAAAHLIGAVCLGKAWYGYLIGALLAIPFFIAWMKGLFGGGDVKLLFAIGLYLGISLTLVSLAFALVVCICMVIRRAVSRRGIRVRLPLAPVLSIGAVMAVAPNYLF